MRRHDTSVVVRSLWTLTVALLVTAEALAQDSPSGSRNLPVDHWAYEYVQRLRSRGHLQNLNPLVQPYRRLEVARGLAGLDPDTLGHPMAHWVRILRDELRPELDRIEARQGRSWGIELTAGARSSTSDRFDVLRPVGSSDFWPLYTAAAWAETGPFVAEMRMRGDTYLSDDPDGLDPGQRRGGRSDNAYLSATFPFGGVTLGRLKRNWSTLGTRGLMVSDVPVSYPQIAFEVNAQRLALRAFTGELETLDSAKRYLAAHRLDYHSGDFVFSVGESILYASRRSGLSLRFLNPFEFLFFDHDNEPADVAQNLTLDTQLWYRRGGVVLFLEGLLDDVDVIPGERDPEPLLYAFTLVARVTSIVPWAELGMEYQQVAAFAYRTPNVIDNYFFLERGLGENFSDYDRLTLSADLFPRVPGLRLTPTVQFQRQGEGNFRDPVPPMDEYLASPTLFLGVKETTFRLGLRGRYQPNRYFWIAWDVGENFIRSADHIPDNNVWKFSAIASFGVTLELPIRKTSGVSGQRSAPSPRPD